MNKITSSQMIAITKQKLPQINTNTSNKYNHPSSQGVVFVPVGVKLNNIRTKLADLLYPYPTAPPIYH